MANLLNFFYPFCFFFFFSVSVSSQLTDFFYSGFKGVSTCISLNGIAEIKKNGIIRLTNETSRLMGRAFYSSPLKFKNSANDEVFSFSTSFAFAIVPEYPRLGGHGLAFTIATSTNLTGALPSQYLGLLNSSNQGNFTNHLFAVEFDTVQDFEFGDIDDNHVGIDINRMKSNASATAGYYTDGSWSSAKQDLNLKGGEPILVWVEYDSVQKVINVTTAPTSKKPPLPILSFPLDLTPFLQEYMYVGFSASTGLLASSHFLLGWSFKMNGVARSLDLSSLPTLRELKHSHVGLTTGVSVASCFLAIVVVSAVVYVVRRIRNADIIEGWELEIGPHRYTWRELKKATHNFSENELLGRGGFGHVYKGTLPDSKTPVAVKRISNDSKQGLREYVSEIGTIGRLRHRNLVQLVGWCRRKKDFLLVYDYMENGSLEKLLFDEPKMVLSWEQRFKIVKDVASALLYLHEGYEKVVIHRDIKASNVLLDSELNARVGDFGLARLYEHGAHPHTTRVVGTFGYLAPELPKTGKATEGSDVFAFGALLLEVVCGRRPIEPKALPEELVLVDWVWDNYREGRVLEVVDRKLNGQFNEEEVLMVIKLGIMCSNNVAAARPKMRQVLRYLDGEVPVPDNVRNPSGGYDRVRGNCERGNCEGFDDFVHSFPSSSFDKMSSSSFIEIGDGVMNTSTTLVDGRD